MGKKLAESNVLVKKDFNIERDNMQLEEQKQYSMNMLKTGFLNFRIQEEELTLIIWLNSTKLKEEMRKALEIIKIRQIYSKSYEMVIST